MRVQRRLRDVGSMEQGINKEVEEEERRYSELRGEDRFRDMRTGERRERSINSRRDDEAGRSAGNIREEEDWPETTGGERVRERDAIEEQ